MIADCRFDMQGWFGTEHDCSYCDPDRCDAAHQRTLDGAGKTPQEAQAGDDVLFFCRGSRMKATLLLAPHVSAATGSLRSRSKLWWFVRPGLQQLVP